MDVLAAALSAIVLVAAVFGFTTVALIRQNGRLLERMDALEAQVAQSHLESTGLPMDILSLTVRANLPAAVARGGEVPSYQLADPDGKMVDLAGFRGRNTVLIFWDPASSQCQFMLPDLKTLTRVSLTDVPDVVIVASRPVSVRALGLELPVLLDPHGAARALFGATATPSAVLIDSTGHMASELHEGYVPTFELTGLAPYVPTEPPTVAAMLELASVRKDDVVYDIGCGDGRIVVMAASHYGARGVGVDVNPERLAEGRANATKASVEHLVRFDQSEFLDCDLRDATVVTLYLMPGQVAKVQPKLLAELRPGARIVAHAFGMVDWAPDRETTINGDTIYLWTIPTRA